MEDRQQRNIEQIRYKIVCVYRHNTSLAAILLNRETSVECIGKALVLKHEIW